MENVSVLKTGSSAFGKLFQEYCALADKTQLQRTTLSHLFFILSYLLMVVGKKFISCSQLSHNCVHWLAEPGLFRSAIACPPCGKICKAEIIFFSVNAW